MFSMSCGNGVGRKSRTGTMNFREFPYLQSGTQTSHGVSAQDRVRSGYKIMNHFRSVVDNVVIYLLIISCAL